LNSPALSFFILPFPIPGLVSKGLIFQFTYMCTQYLHSIKASLFKLYKMYSELWHTSVVSEATFFYKCHCYIQSAEVRKISNPFLFVFAVLFARQALYHRATPPVWKWAIFINDQLINLPPGYIPSSICTINGKISFSII
jgi:hypothetical protein